MDDRVPHGQDVASVLANLGSGAEIGCPNGIQLRQLIWVRMGILAWV
jgi:hypothetical protein